MLLLLTVAWADAAECEAGTTTAVIAADLTAAESAFEKRDKVAMVTAAEKARSDLPCLKDAVTPALAARFHRVQGLRAFLQQDEGSAIRSFAAARAIEPNYALPETMVPAAHPARVLYEMAPVAVASFAPVPAVAGSLRLDGRDLQARPTDRPVIYQLFDEKGGVVTTFCLQPSDPLPALPAPLAVAPVVLPPPPPAATATAAAPLPTGSVAPVAGHSGPNKPLLYGAIGGLVASGVLYGIAGAEQAAYNDLDPIESNRGQFEDLYATNHGLILSAGVTAGLSVVAGVCSFAVKF